MYAAVQAGQHYYLCMYVPMYYLVINQLICSDLSHAEQTSSIAQ